MNLPTKVRGFLKIHVANISLLYHYIIQMNFQFLSWDTIYHIKEFSLALLLECVCAYLIQSNQLFQTCIDQE